MVIDVGLVGPLRKIELVILAFLSTHVTSPIVQLSNYIAYSTRGNAYSSIKKSL